MIDRAQDTWIAGLPTALAATATTLSAARVYDYLLGGTHNCEVDRTFVETRIRPLLPRVGDYVRENRRFVHRAVRFACAAGIRQFVDIGSGLPAEGNVHDTADRACPAGDTRVVYVDNDPIAAALSEHLLAERGDPARHRALRADLMDPADLWRQVEQTGVIDLTRPLCLLVVAVLHFIADADDPDEAMRRHRDHVPPGSALVLSAMSTEAAAGAAEIEQLAEFYRDTPTPVRFRDRQDLIRFFGGWRLTEPGLVFVPEWRPDEPSLFDRPQHCPVIGGVALHPDR